MGATCIGFDLFYSAILVIQLPHQNVILDHISKQKNSLKTFSITLPCRKVVNRKVFLQLLSFK